MTVETILAKTMTEVPRALAAGVVDMTTGALLGFEAVDDHPREALAQVAGACGALFEGQDVAMLEGVLQQLRGARPRERYLTEIVVASTERVRIFARLGQHEPAVLVVECRTDVDMGLALVKTRAITTDATV